MVDRRLSAPGSGGSGGDSGGDSDDAPGTRTDFEALERADRRLRGPEGGGDSGGDGGVAEPPDPINIGGDVDLDDGESPGGTRTDLDATEPVDEQLGGGDNAFDTISELPGGAASAAAAGVDRGIGAAQNSPVGALGGAAVDRARTFADVADKRVVDPAAGVSGRAFEVAGTALAASNPLTAAQVSEDQAEQTAADGELNLADPQTTGGQVGERFVGGAGEAVVETPASVLGAGGTAVEATEFSAEAVAEEGPVAGSATAAAAGASVASKTADEAVTAAQERPASVAGALAGGTAASTALSPLRVSRVDLPRDRDAEADTPDSEAEAASNLVDAERGPSVGPTADAPPSDTITLRGLRLAEPRILQGRADTPGVTLGGTVDGRPTTGTPRPDVDDVDFDELGNPGKGQAAEPTGRFETDVFRGLAATDPDALERFTAAEDLVDTATRQGGELELESTEDIVRQAEDIPDEAAPDVADALSDVDATIFGSASVRAQVPEARTPRDLDIAVDDPAAAKPRLSRALEGTDADINAFDIKAREERATPGEIVKFGRLAQDRLETDDGVKVTPAGEELLKKAGASAFIRGEGSPAPEFDGRTGEFDVGPEPSAEGSFPRVKDPGDAAAVGTAMTDDPGALGTLSPFARRDRERVRTFRDRFEPEIERSLAEPGDPPSAGVTPDFDDPLGVRAFVADESAQLGGGRTAGAGPRRGRSGQQRAAADDRTDRRGDSDGQRPDAGADRTSQPQRPGTGRSSPGDRGDFDSPVPTPASFGRSRPSSGDGRGDGGSPVFSGGGGDSPFSSGGGSGGGSPVFSGGGGDSPFSSGGRSGGGGSPVSSGGGDSPFSSGGGSGGGSPSSGGGGSGGGGSSPGGGSPFGGGGPGSSTPQPPTFEDEDDDDPFDIPTGDGPAAGFVNPVASASELLSSDDEPGGQASETGNDGLPEAGLFGGGRR